MPHFATNAQAQKWYESTPGKVTADGSISVDTLGLWGNLYMDEYGAVTFRRGPNGESITSMPDNTIRAEPYATPNPYHYGYGRRWAQIAMYHLMGIKCTQRHKELWIPCLTDFYEGVGFIPLIQDEVLTFVMPDGDNYHPHCTNPVFRTVKQIDRAGKKEVLTPYKPFLTYAKGILKLRDDTPLTYKEVSTRLEDRMPGINRYDMLRQTKDFDAVCAAMLSDDPMLRYRTVYHLVLAGSNRLNDYRWGADTEANPQACLDHAINTMFANNMPDKVLKEVTPTTGKIIASQYT
jgi:hypothetical protein